MAKKRNLAEFNFTVNGEIDQISVRKLTTSLLALNDAMSVANAELNTQSNYELHVKTYKPGSFDIYLELIRDGLAIASVAGLHNQSGLETAKSIIDFTVSYIGLKKHLRGQKPKEIIKINDKSVTIENNYGNIIQIDKLVLDASKNQDMDNNVIALFKSIQEISFASGVTIKDNEKNPLLELDKLQDFRHLIKENPMILDETIEQTDEEVVDEAILSVLSVVFSDNRKWDFYYLGNKIPVKLLDDDFIQKVLKREQPLLNGDKLRCKLLIEKEYNHIAQVYENKRYLILEVHEVLPPQPIQEKMNFKNEKKGKKKNGKKD
jgi:hypothetical protein